jgi:glycosyltransferase 2 family protein
MKKKYLGLVLRLAISAGLIGYFLYKLAQSQGGLGGALDQFVRAFSGASPGWLIPAALLHLVGFSLVSLRWQILLRAQEVKASYRQLFSYYFMAAFFNTVLPSTIGGDAVRALESKRLTGKTTTSVMVVIVERLTGLMALVLIAFTALVIKIIRGGAHHPGIWIFLAAATLAFSMMVIFFHPGLAPRFMHFLKKVAPAGIHSWLEQAYAAVAAFYKRPFALLQAVAISIVFQLNMVIYYLLIASALHQAPQPLEFMLKVPVMIFLLMVVPAVNGIGVRTASFKGLMEYPAAYALAMEFIDLAFKIGWGLLGGLLFLFHRRSVPRGR